MEADKQFPVTVCHIYNNLCSLVVAVINLSFFMQPNRHITQRWRTLRSSYGCINSEAILTVCSLYCYLDVTLT